MEPRSIVGVGASAGGVEAIIQFFGVMPANSGAAFVVILHLDPRQHSYLGEILAKHTTMPVVEVSATTPLAADTVYVIVPGHDLTVSGAMLVASKSDASERHRHPVDVLFRSIAEVFKQRGIGIILSGTGSNGTQGARDIREAGGIVLVQDPLASLFDGMPSSAISAGMADYVLTPAEMPLALLNYIDHRQARPPEETGADTDAMAKLLDHVARSAGAILTNYRKGTLLRRIHRRMSLKGCQSLEAYLDLVVGDDVEGSALVADLLINVTGFYRDPEAWDFLAREVVPELVGAQADGGTLRIWVPACSTGEEAYSLAMLVVEQSEATPSRLTLNVFATDLLENNLRVARQGIYPAASVETLPPRRIRRFFDNLGTGHYQVKSQIRQAITFARHDLLRNPPFARVDFLSCRNMLIYVEPRAQAQALAVFHFALKPGGTLFLGSAENTSRVQDLFEPISKQWRVYRRVGTSPSDMARFGAIGRLDTGSTGLAPEQFSARLVEGLRRALLERYVPTAVVVNAARRIIYFHGNMQPFMRPPSGEPTLDVLAMIHDGLRRPLRKGIEAIKTGVKNVNSRVMLREGTSLREIDLRLVALPVLSNVSDLVLITFEAACAARTQVAEDVSETTSTDLAAELHLTRTELQETIRELEIANDELLRAHADVVLVNEELQSTNEELETSKEELQSFNEELHSVNSQLQQKINESEENANNLHNLLSGTEIATIFLDLDLRIRWSSPAVSQLFDLVHTDVGRPLGHFSRKFSDEQLLDDAQEVLARLAPLDKEIRNDKGAWFLRRILPYRTRDQRVAGLVLTFFDITAQRMSAAADSLRHLNQELERRVAERTEALEHANRELVRQRLEQKRVEDAMQFLAHHDRLTGVPNREQLAILLSPLLAGARSGDGQVAILCLDLDGFKRVNDTMGHLAGDRLLQALTSRLMAVLTPRDILARIGGDEFVIVRPGIADRDEIEELARTVVSILSEPATIDGQTARVGASIGIVFAPADGVDPERLLQNADIALYKAKTRGGGTWQNFTADMFLEQTRLHTMEADLRRALLDGEFLLHFQPIVAAADRRIQACEALLRWQHPAHGLLFPDAFIGVAERTGLIVDIGRWVMLTACRVATAWPDDVAIAVNMSGAQLRHASIVGDVAAALAETGLASHRLEVEVTESIMLASISDAHRTLTDLRALGVTVAMDDFGSGYSSLTQLRAFPYGRLKLESSFARSLGQGNDSMTIVKTVLLLGRELGMRVTVEGVETADQLDILVRLGCPDVQGYLFGHPVDAETIGRRLARSLEVRIG